MLNSSFSRVTCSNLLCVASELLGISTHRTAPISPSSRSFSSWSVEILACCDCSWRESSRLCDESDSILRVCLESTAKGMKTLRADDPSAFLTRRTFRWLRRRLAARSGGSIAWLPARSAANRPAINTLLPNAYFGLQLQSCGFEWLHLLLQWLTFLAFLLVTSRDRSVRESTLSQERLQAILQHLMVRNLLLIHHIHTNNRFELAAALFDELRELVDRVARRLELVDSRTLLSTLWSLEERKARYGGIELSDALQFVQ